MPEISVIVPVYNVEQFLPRCLESVLKQTFTDIEVIVVDDGSQDQSGKICDDYATRDKRVIVIHQKNSKVSAARNAGLNIAQGEWIAFIDSDDWIHNEYLQVLYSGIHPNTDIVICDCIITSNSAEQDCTLQDVQFESLRLHDLEANHIMRDRAWGRLYRRKTIGDLRFLSGAEPEEDTLFNDCYLNEHMGISVTNAKLYYYYMRDDSAIHDEMSRRFLSSTEAIIGFLKDVPETEKRQKVIIRCYKMLLSVRYLEVYSADYSIIKMKCKSLFALLDPYLVELNFKEKVKYRILKDFPLLYRQWRIMGDPSLIQYEKEKRKKRQSIRFLG